MNVNVDQYHIDQANSSRMPGEFADADKCPIALALRELGVVNVFVDPEDAIIQIDSPALFWPMPIQVTEWAQSFDHGEVVYPFGFVINPNEFT